MCLKQDETLLLRCVSHVKRSSKAWNNKVLLTPYLEEGAVASPVYCTVSGTDQMAAAWAHVLLFSERVLVCALLSVNGKFQEGSPSESLWICFLCSARAGDIYIQNYRSSVKGRAAQPVLTCVFWRPPPLQSCNLHLNCPLIGVLTVFHNRILHLSPLCQTKSLCITQQL